MSPDSVKCHDGIHQETQRCQSNLTADEEKTTLEAYGVWKQKTMYGRNFMGVERTTFLIREDGTIGTIWQKSQSARPRRDRACRRAESVAMTSRSSIASLRGGAIDAIRAADLDEKTTLAQETATR